MSRCFLFSSAKPMIRALTGCPLPSTTLLPILHPTWALLTLTLLKSTSDSGTLVRCPETPRQGCQKFPGNVLGWIMSPHWPVQEGSEPTALVGWNQVGPAAPPQHFPPPSSRYNGPNLVLKYDRAQKRLVNIAVDERSSPYYALRDRQGNAIGVTACDIDGDGREEIYFLNTNNAFSGKGCGPWAFPRKEAPTFLLPSPGYSHQLPQGQALPPLGPRFVPAMTQQ